MPASPRMKECLSKDEKCREWASDLIARQLGIPTLTEMRRLAELQGRKFRSPTIYDQQLAMGARGPK